ncbi:GNAT family N-acetyltransferase [Flagellimonas sp.]|uniref:GNAT family N-acetyltransferase n=1 Tax=Flagellimonas sp. TaxID=2058762 RepID=UPI003F4A189B
MAYELRKCTLSDLKTLLRISKETFVITFEKDNNPEDFQKYVESTFTEENLKLQLQQKTSQFYFVFEGSSLIGYLKLNEAEAQTDIHDQNSMELERIYLLEEHQGKGAGRWMLERAIELCRKKKDIKYVWLGVWEHNLKAIRFYEKYGFKKFAEHSFFIGKDEQTDWLMRLDFE